MTVTSPPDSVPSADRGPAPDEQPTVDFATDPSRYRHWQLSIDGPIARLVLDVDEHGGLVPGYELKMNSYDLGVDIELYDATQRIRFEHPEVRAVVVTSGKDRMFCAGANIRMLAGSPHHWKVNFCKFTNETRNGIEDASASSGITFIAALNGSAAGGGYEIALACDEIVLVDDGSSAVSLPEVPLLGVLPGTGGLTRLVDKRHVRRDHADVVATRVEGIRGRTAVDWGLVDDAVPPRAFDDAVLERARAAVARNPRSSVEAGVPLPPLDRVVDETGLRYRHVACVVDRAASTATITVTGPDAVPDDLAAFRAQGAAGWLLAMTRELDDLVLWLRTNEPTVGTWLLNTAGDPAVALRYDDLLLAHLDDWLVAETTHYLKRVLKRLDVTSRSLIAVALPGSCFAGTLAELVLVADRSYVLDGLRPEDEDAGLPPATVTLSAMNVGPLPMGNGLSRLATRFLGRDDALRAAREVIGRPLDANGAVAAGLVTFAYDDIDFDDELRLAVEERASFSPDALTGMEANNRFAGPETMETKIFGRLSAWQNWIFTRPNASGESGALRRYGSGQRPAYDRKRV
jgi:benzoyl-CoA-dihydrodiol lyase